MHLFSHIKEGTHLKRNANFSNFAVAMLTLFRISSGADWNGLMHDMMISEGCTEGVDCGSPILAPIYYVSFLLLASFILLNLFVAVVLDQFKINVAFEADRTKSIEITKFVRLWEIHDPDATHTIPTRAFPAFLQQLGEPLGLQPQVSACLPRGRFVPWTRPAHTRLQWQSSVQGLGEGLTFVPQAARRQGMRSLGPFRASVDCCPGLSLQGRDISFCFIPRRTA